MWLVNKTYVWYVFVISFWISANAYAFVSVNLTFIMHFFYLGCYINMLFYRQSYFGHLFGILDFNERMYILWVNLSCIMHFFLGGDAKKYAGLQKITFWAVV